MKPIIAYVVILYFSFGCCHPVAVSTESNVEKTTIYSMNFNMDTNRRISREEVMQNSPQILHDGEGFPEIFKKSPQDIRMQGKVNRKYSGIDVRMVCVLDYSNNTKDTLCFGSTVIYQINQQIYKDKKRQLLKLFMPIIPEKQRMSFK